MKTALRFYPGGRVVAIHDDAFPFSAAFGADFAAARRRASLINTVEEGPHAGCFYADMSLLAERTGNERHRVCLWPPRPTEAACKQDEFAYVERCVIDGREDTWPDAAAAPAASHGGPAARAGKEHAAEQQTRTGSG